MNDTQIRHGVLKASAQFLLDAFPGSHVNDWKTSKFISEMDFLEFMVPCPLPGSISSPLRRFSLEINSNGDLAVECWEANLLTFFDLADPAFCDQLVGWIREGISRRDEHAGYS